MHRTKSFGFSSMGVRDSANLSMESSFKDLERVISLLLDDYNPTARCSEIQLQPQPQALANYFVEDKANYFNKVSSNIMETKKNFLKFYADITSSIEEMTRQIVLRVKARELQLKAELLEIRAEKIAKWDCQLAVCQEALEQLRKAQVSPSSGDKDGSAFFTGEELAKQLQFVDAAEVKFQLVNYSEILESLKTVGKISYHVSRDDGLDCLKSITPKFVFGGSGEEPGQFCRSWGICADATGRILVCDRSNHRVQIFNECGQFLIQFGKEGTKAGEFNRPTGIEVDDKFRIIVADKDNHRIQVFAYSGYYLFEFGVQGTRPGQFMYPWDVSTNKDCHIAVSDSKNHRIQLFNDQGNFIALFDAHSMGIWNPRTALRYLDSPRGLAFRPDGSLLVTDFNNHRVLLINKTFNKVTTFGGEGMKSGQFFRPQGIACDKTGRFAVADSKNYRVQVFDGDGALLQTFGNQGNDPGQFDCPQGISFHPNQNILVVDLSNNRVQVF